MDGHVSAGPVQAWASILREALASGWRPVLLPLATPQRSGLEAPHFFKENGELPQETPGPAGFHPLRKPSPAVTQTLWPVFLGQQAARPDSTCRGLAARGQGLPRPSWRGARQVCRWDGSRGSCPSAVSSRTRVLCLFVGRQKKRMAWVAALLCPRGAGAGLGRAGWTEGTCDWLLWARSYLVRRLGGAAVVYSAPEDMRGESCPVQRFWVPC